MPDSPSYAEILRDVEQQMGEALTDEKRPMAERYARALDLARRCWDAVPARSVLGKTDRGGQRVHPAIDAALKAERAAAEFGQALGLEQPVRRAPGRPAGAASAPDRAPRIAPRLRSVK